MIVLPINPNGAPSFSFQTDLDAVTYTFSFCWNETAAAWFMAIADAAQSPIVTGVRIVTSFSLGGRSTDVRLFTGILYAVDTSGQNLDPGLADFGSRVILRYAPLADLQAAGY